MNWVLFVVLATSTGSDKAINATPVPMATEQLCNEAKNKLFGELPANQYAELCNRHRVPESPLAVKHQQVVRALNPAGEGHAV